MSTVIGRKMTGKEKSRDELLALNPNVDYEAFRESEDKEVRERELRTKQAFKDTTDVNKILDRAQKAGSLAHVQKYDSAEYGEFEGYDLLEAHRRVTKAQQIFNDLPSEIRSEFGGDAFKFAEYASNPENINRLPELLPAIAKPDRFFPNPASRDAATAALAEATAEAKAAPPAPSTDAPAASEEA